MDEPHENFEFNGFHLPQEVRLLTASGPKDVVLDWTPILNHEGRVIRILIAFHDVTELRSLKQEQATQSRMLVRLNQLLSADDMALRVFLIHGRRTMDAMYEPITAVGDIPLLVQRLFIDFHTLKGESRSLGLTELSEQFHLMEDRLDQVRCDVRRWRASELLHEIGKVEGLMAEFASLYEKHIGSLTEERVVPIRQGKLEQWERALQRLTPRGTDEGAAHRLLLSEVFHILHMDLTTYEEKLQNQARRLAREIGKPDPQVLLAGQGIFLSQRLVEQLDHVFVHILQNALVHGLESADGRRAAGKSLAGLIYINLARNGREVVLTARDDGRGVNIQAIREKARTLGLLTTDDVMSDQELENCLLHAGLSCREDVGTHAGRGVGMGAVRQFVEGLEGRMHLEFAPERDGHRTFALVMTFPAALFPTISSEPLQAA
jgi:chemotaxis protein histidine kinase CheA